MDSTWKAEKDGGMRCSNPGHTDLLSLLCSFLSPPRSHFLRRERLRHGEALGVDEPEPTASSSLDGVISMEGSCRYSLEPSVGSLSLCICFIRRILKRLRRSDGLGQVGFSPLADPTCSTSQGACTCSAGSCRVSVMLVLFPSCGHNPSVRGDEYKVFVIGINGSSKIGHKVQGFRL